MNGYSVDWSGSTRSLAMKAISGKKFFMKNNMRWSGENIEITRIIPRGQFILFVCAAFKTTTQIIPA